MIFARLGLRMGSKTKPRDVEIATKPQFFNKMSSMCDKVIMKLEVVKWRLMASLCLGQFQKAIPHYLLEKEFFHSSLSQEPVWSSQK